MKSFNITIHVAVLMVIGATAGAQGVPDAWESTAEMPFYSGFEPLSLLVRPDGAGMPFAQAFAPGGIQANATVEVTVRDGLGSPIENFPAEDIWLESIPVAGQRGLTACGGTAVAEHNTDVQGVTHFQAPLFAGGQSTNNSEVVLAGNPLASGDVNLRFNSPDIDGNGVTNLSDAGYFTIILFGGYDYTGDFNYDGVVNVTDAGFMSGGMGTRCP